MKAIKYLLAASIFTSANGFAKHNSEYDYARVIEAEPIIKVVRVNAPRRECWQEQVAYRDRGQYRSATPTLVGSIIGGLIGNEVGHNKDAKRAGVVVGALVGGSIARDITQRNNRDIRTRYATEEVCETYDDYHEEERILGYNVLYKYHGRLYRTETSDHPGDRIRVEVSIRPAEYR